MEEVSVLIYDGDCPYCTSISRILGKIDDVLVLPYQDTESKEFLRSQFGEAPFAMYLVDVEKGVVYGGESAAKELCRRAGLPELVSDLVRDRYETVSFIIGKVSGRENDVSLDYDDVYKIRVEDGTLENLVNAAGVPDEGLLE
ncbi:MAG: DUF393 domain-containing protein [Halobacteria archaeon]